jgi:L-threonylcarbamoyladenylate synthase
MQEQLSRAVKKLRGGGLVAFPTETVYGLGADARNEHAISKVFAIKKRPIDHPLTIHIATIEQIKDWAINIPDLALELAKSFWPGPLTMILPKHPKVSNLITGNQNTIAIRIPRHSLTLTMLQQFGSGIVGPSANTYGRISPTSAQHVKQDLGSKVDYILDGGQCEVGIESTIINITNNTPQILRQGVITQEDITKIIGNDLLFINTIEESTIKVPGLDKTHYAPIKPLYLVESQEFLAIAKFMSQQGLNYSYLSFQECFIKDDKIIWIQAEQNPLLYARNLYTYLHQLDLTNNAKGIIVEMPPNGSKWQAIIERLTKASNGKLTVNYSPSHCKPL